MARRRRFVVEVPGIGLASLNVREARWLVERLEPLYQDSITVFDSLAIRFREELENRHPRPIALNPAEVDALHTLTTAYAESYPRWETLQQLHALLDAARETRG